MSKVQDLLKSITEDDLYLSRSKTQWNLEDDLSTKMYNDLFPHINNYEVSIPSFFLYELNDLSYLNYFPIILIRDGAFSLAKFFLLNPEPKNIKTLLVLHSKLSFLVPEQWLKQVAFYNTGSSNLDINISNKTDVYISLLGSTKFCDLDYVKTISQQILADTSGLPIDLTIVANHNHPLGEKNSHSKIDPYIFYAIDTIRSILSKTSSVNYINTTDVEYLNLENSLFYDLNQFNALFSDCYVAHNIMAKGAYKVTPSKIVTESTFYHPISFFHGYYISSRPSESYKSERDRYVSSFDLIQPFLNENEFQLQRNSSDLNSLSVIGPEFESLISNFLRSH